MIDIILLRIGRWKSSFKHSNTLLIKITFRIVTFVGCGVYYWKSYCSIIILTGRVLFYIKLNRRVLLISFIQRLRQLEAQSLNNFKKIFLLSVLISLLRFHLWWIINRPVIISDEAKLPSFLLLKYNR